MWPVSPAPVVSSQTILDGKPPTNKSSTQGRNTGCGCVPAWLPALNFALVFKTPGIYFKKIQLLFTLRWPLALHDIIPVSCRINLPANPSFTRDIYLILWKPGAQLKMPCPLESPVCWKLTVTPQTVAIQQPTWVLCLCSMSSRQSDSFM